MNKIYGFQTAHGSLYAYDSEAGRTMRLKKSPGQGQGEIDPLSVCVFVSQQDVQKITELYLGMGHATSKL